MKDVIIHMTKVKPGTTLASAKIATFLQKTLDLPLIDEKPKTIEAYRNVFVINGPTAFCPFRPAIASIGRKAKNMVWIQNDFTCAPPSQLNKVIRARNWTPDGCKHLRLPVIWGTIPERYIEPLDRYINWNSLSYDGQHLVDGSIRGVLYYGAYRNQREAYFEKYLKTTKYPITVSTSNKAASKFYALNSRIDVVRSMDHLVEQVGQFQLAVYMEDRYSHTHYTSPANRFYECLSAGIAQVFDENSVSTFQGEWAVKTGQVFGIDEFVVTGPGDVATALKYWKSIARKQARWHTDYRALLKAETKKAYKQLLKGALA